LLALRAAAEELFAELRRDGFEVHEVAVATASAGVLLVLTAGGLAEVGDGAELGHDGAPLVEAASEALHGVVGAVLVFEFGVDVADEVVGKIVAHVEVLELAKFTELEEDVVIEVVEVFLKLLRGVVALLAVISAGGSVGRLVHVGDEHGLRDGRPVVHARASVSVPACADCVFIPPLSFAPAWWLFAHSTCKAKMVLLTLEEERAVNAIPLRAVYACQPIRHIFLRAMAPVLESAYKVLTKVRFRILSMHA